MRFCADTFYLAHTLCNFCCLANVWAEVMDRLLVLTNMSNYTGWSGGKKSCGIYNLNGKLPSVW
jgi:hypothetical protein